MPSNITTKANRLEKLSASEKNTQARIAVKTGSRRMLTETNPEDNSLRLYVNRE